LGLDNGGHFLHVSLALQKGQGDRMMTSVEGKHDFF
jgi:hypothetical protein